MKRTPAYQFTVKMENGAPVVEDMSKVKELRAHVKWHNAQMKKEETLIYGRTVGKQALYGKLQGRLGKDTLNATKYRTGAYNSHQMIALSDSQTADVYVYTRSAY